MLLVFSFAATVYAAPVGITSEADARESELWPNEDWGLSIGFVADMVDKRGIDIDDGEFEMEAYVGRIGISAIDRFYLYVDIGEAQNMEYSCYVNSAKVIYDYDDDLIWGLGINALAYRWNNGLELGVSASYRQTDMNFNKTTIEGVLYQENDLDSVRDGEFKEWQVGCELAWKTEYFIPYIGVKYSDVEVDGDVTLSNIQYNASGKNAGDNIGAFVGLAITPILPELFGKEQVAINLEARFIDEEAFTAGISYKY